MSESVALPRRAVTLPRAAAFWSLAALLMFLLFASAAPTPMYVLYQRSWGFSPVTLTGVYAAYALALLVALLFAGSLSDHVGRRPVLAVAVGVELAGMLVFAEADGVGWLFAGRILQGLATGIATGAISATLIDLQPPGTRLGPLMANSASAGGLATGAVLTGLLVQYGPSPTRLVYWLLAGVFVLAALIVAALPETVAAPDRAWRTSLRPKVSAPPEARGPFLALIPSIAATWALAGLFLSLAGSILRVSLHLSGPVVTGLAVVALQGSGAVMAVVARDWPARRGVWFGPLTLIAGVAVALPGLAAHSPALFFTGAVLAGIGFGPSFSGALGTLTALAPPDRRAEMVTAIFVVSYLALSLPAVAAGIAVQHAGLPRTVYVYGGAVIVLEAAALAGTLLRRRSASGTADDAAELAPAPGAAVPCPRAVARSTRCPGDRAATATASP
ncbi:MFS transporter [Actinomadura rupiterrae]|uniref:MFS transporter n=1 Tax=Actinomadura rupiterrae TaxID=559627 RepID=UPI0020A53328|nr:MFS transporter [Actinomadura rupiterrae]MCP2341210.1 MFS family permease [Actinomadura rupiterrae]